MSRNYTHNGILQPVSIAFIGMVLALLFSVNANAADSAGRLLFTRGDVQITSVDAEPRAAKRGDLLQVGDTIRTGSASSAQLRMSDGAMIALKASTEFRIEAQEYNAKAPGEGSQVGELVRGGLRAITGAIGHEKPEAVSYRTPVATIGIRGTVFDTIVIPPEGLPELPGMAPGTYVMVLEGQVLLSTATGELLLGPGEVGYVPFIDAPPELRPDLSPVFVEFAAFEEPDRPKTPSGKETYSRTAINQQDRIYTLMADVGGAQILAANGTSATVTPGPFAMVTVGTAGVGMVAPIQGSFFDPNNPVVLGGNSGGELQSATGGTGTIADFQLNPQAPFPPTSVGQPTVAGDSTVNWGTYAAGSVVLLDAAGGTIVNSTNDINYINATNVIVSTADLPTLGSYTYNYVGGSGQQLLSGSNLTVDFGSATMDVTLYSDIYGTTQTYSASNQAIADFYGNGIGLNSTVAGGASGISGRFVGSGAEGAISNFWLWSGDGYFAGTGAFVR